MRKMGIFRGLAAVACMCCMVTAANADLVQFSLENDAAVSYPLASGATINFELYVEIIDDDADGADTQGLNGYVGNLLTDTGTAPTLAHSATNMNTTYIYTTLDPLWSSAAMAPPMIGGFGMGFIQSLGTVVGDDIIGPGAFMDLVWDADGSTAAGLQPPALAGIGYGTPSTAVDSGGTALDPAYGDVRSRWYLLAGTVAVPAAAGTYTVEWEDGETNVIIAGLDLTADITTGYLESATITGSRAGDSFSFTVVPEPATMSMLLIAGAGLVMRRRR